MLFEVVKTYELEASDEKKAKEIIEALEAKNLQGLFFKRVSTYQLDRKKRIWKVW
jgi:hypothetical protein